MDNILRRGSLYILMAALLTGALWRGAYFPTPPDAFSFPGSLFTPRWSMTALLLLAGAWELAALAAGRRAPFLFLRSPLFWLFAAFTCLSGATYLWSSYPAVTVKDLMLLLSFLSVVIVVRGQLGRFPARTAATISSWLVYTAVFVCTWGIVTYILRSAPYANQVDGIYRAGGTLEYSNALGCFALMALPFAVALMAGARREDLPLLGTAATLLSASVLLSLSRSALVLFAAVSVYLLVKSRGGMVFVLTLSSLGFGLGLAATAMVFAETGLGGRGMVFPAVILPLTYYTQEYLLAAGRERALRISYAAGAVLLAAAALAVTLTARARNIIFERFGEGFTWSRLLPHREDTWAGAVDAFRERPLRGWGLGSFPQVYQDFSITSYTKYAHNLVLQAAVDSGALGAALMGLFLLYIAAISVLRLVRGGALRTAAAVAALVFIFFNMFDWEWYVPAMAAWFMAVAVLVEAGGEAGAGATDPSG